MPKSRPLIPDHVRALYEQLLDEDGRVMTPGDAAHRNSLFTALLDSGLGQLVRLQPPLVLPSGPEAALAYLLARWQRRMNTHIVMRQNVERAAVRLQQAAVRQSVLRRSGNVCVIIHGRNRSTAMYSALHASAEMLTRDFVTGPYGEPRTLPGGEPHPIETNYLETDLQYRLHGGRSRTLHDQEDADSSPSDLDAELEAGDDVRVVEDKLPTKMLIIDEHTALVALGPYGHPCLLIRDAQLVALLIAFFDAKWAEGIPWERGGASATSPENLTRQRVLDGLASGLKDEAIARHLGLSARTVRRHAAQIMQDLGVTTRFAAGVAAVRQGLVAKGAA